MFEKKVRRQKQGLQIDIEESESQIQQNNEHDQQEGLQQNESDQTFSSNQEEEEDDHQSSYQGSGDDDFDENQSIEDQSHQKYMSVGDEDYLIEEDAKLQSNYLRNSQYLSSIKIKQSPQSFNIQQKDDDVQKIIHEVLLRRKEKEQRQQLLESIMKSDKKKSEYRNNFEDKLVNQNKKISNKKSSHVGSALQKTSQKYLQSHYNMMKKCQELQRKIEKMVRKKEQIQKSRKLREKQKQREKQKKATVNMSQKERSFQKLKKRLQKALNLNLNLSKRLKVQKSQLSSLQITNSIQSQVKQPTINQQSTIKVNENGSSIYVKGKDRQKGQSEVRQCFGSSSQTSRNQPKSKVVRKGYDQKGNKKRCGSPVKYKSPILQFNSYLIDESVYRSPQLQRENIYIEDGMTVKSMALDPGTKKITQQNEKATAQLQQLIEKYQLLEMQQKGLQQRVEINSRKIKEYENQHYQKIVS